MKSIPSIQTWGVVVLFILLPGWLWAANSDLQLTGHAVKPVVTANELTTCTLEITNGGPGTANSVVVTNWLPAGATLFAVTTSQGTYTNSAGALRFSLGTLSSGAGAVAGITFFSGTPTLLTNRAWVSSSSNDPQPSNNGVTNVVSVLPATFQPAGNMNLPRKWHTATLLPNGKVLITGGSTTNGLTATAELFDPATGTFSLTGNMLYPRHQHSATLLNDGRVLMVGAGVGEAEIYNPANGTFSSAGNLNIARWAPAASRLPDGRVLVTGGYGDETSAEVFEPVAGTWSLVGRMNFSRVYHASVPLPDGRTLLAGGYDAGNNADLFSPTTNGFAPGGTFLKSRSFATILPLKNGTVLLAGGNDISMMFDAELYQPSTQSSVSLGPMTSSRFECPGVVLADGRALLAGGTGYLGIVTPTAELFDPATGGFTPTLSMNARRSGHTATLLTDGRVLVAGGYQDWPQGSSMLASAEVVDVSTAKTPPVIAAADAMWPEGNSGTNMVAFQLTLSAPLGVPASVDFEVSAGTASAWSDFIPVSGTVIFAPGQTNQTISLPVIADQIYESDETVILNLKNATNALLSRSAATGTILNDEPLPMLSVGSVVVTETDRFVTNVAVQILLSAPSALPVSCTFATADGSAVADLDYAATNAVLVFQPGQTNLSVPVSVFGDTFVESSETVLFTLTQLTNAALGSVGTLTILDNDGIPGKLHHFEMDAMPNPAHLDDYAVIFIYAKDFHGNPASYSGPVYLEALRPGTTNYHWDFEDGTLNGWTPLHPGYGDGPYEVVTFETGGERVNGVVGFPSRAFRICPNYGPADGLTRKVSLVGGVPYNFSFSLAESNEGPNWEYAGAQAQFYVNGVNIGGAGWSQYDFMAPGLVNRAKMSVNYTPPTNGLYTLTLTITRDAWESYLYAYVDDIRIEAPPVTPLSQLMWVGLSVGQAIVRVHDLATNLTLRAYDLDGHSGFSNPFDVRPSADVSAQVTVYPTGDTVNSYEPVTLVATVYNAGPSPATGVVLTNVLPGDFQFLSASAEGASVTNWGNTVLCTFSNLAPGAAGSLTIQARTAGEGLRTNLVTVGGNEYDPRPENNPSTTEILVQPPEVHLSNVTVTETPGGTNVLLSVWLGSSNDVPAWVDFATTNVSAVAGVDYLSASGTLVFAPGVTNQTLLLTVLDDAVSESNETFSVVLSNPNHLLLTGATGTVTIVDNDPPPALAIYDTSVVEGDSGVTPAVFSVTLSAPSEQWVTVYYTASPGTAQPDSDYLVPGSSSYISFAPGQTNAMITILVRGNTVNEPDETFFVTLNSPQNATLARAQATCTILNDDAVPGRLDHFVFSPMAEARRAGIAFPIRVSAVDAFGAVVSNYTGSPQISALDAVNPGIGLVVPGVLSNFTQGVWSGEVAINKVFTNGTLSVQDDAEHIGQSAPFKVLWTFPLSITLPAFANENAGVLTNAGQLTTLYTNDSDLELILGSSDTNLLRVANVVLPAGRTNVAFDVTLVDDTLLNGTRTPVISATGPGFATNSASLKVHDNESASLTLSSTAAKPVYEGTSVPFRLEISPPPDTACQVFLSSSDTTELTVPSSIGFSAGATSAVFNATAMDDKLLDGPQTVIVTAHVENWVDGTATVTVLDNESTNLSLVMLWQGPYLEGAGTITNFRRVQISGTLPTNLVVQLTSSDPGKLTIPSSVTILAGQTSSNFNATLPDNNTCDGVQNVNVIASAPGLGSATNVIPVTDNDPHHFVFSTIASPKTSAVPFQVSISARDINDTAMVYFNGSVALGAVAGNRLLPSSPAQTNFIRGSWTGAVAVNSWGTNVQLRAATTNGQFSLSSPFTVLPLPWSGLPAVMTRDGYFGFNEGRFGFNVRAEEGATVVVETSTNLMNWLPMQTNVLDAGEYFFFEDPDSGFAKRFYRVR